MSVGEASAEIGAKDKRTAAFLALASSGTHPGDGFAGTPGPPRGLLGEKDAQTFQGRWDIGGQRRERRLAEAQWRG